MLKKIFLLAAAALIIPANLSAQSSVADLQQDLALLKREVGTLRMEVEQLRRDNESLKLSLQKAGNATASNDAMKVQIAAAKAEMLAQSEANKRDILTQVKKEMESMAQQTNKNMQSLANAIDSRPQAPLPTTFTEDYPKTGVPYVVKSGDTLSKIAKENNSKIKWIQDANKITDINKGLQIGTKLFIPQQ